MITVCGKCLANHIISPIIGMNNGPHCIVCGLVKTIGNKYYIVNISSDEFNNFYWKDAMARQKLIVEENQEIEDAPKGLPYISGLDLVTGQQFDSLDIEQSYFCSREIDKLTAAKVAALKAMDHRAKLDRDNQGKYKYTSFNEFIVHTRPHLLDNGLVLTPIFQKVEKTMVDIGGGKGYEEVTLYMYWKLSHESGQWEIFRVISYANNQDRGGKHFSKALSYNIKDTLRAMGLVPSGDDDPDDDRSKDTLQEQLDNAKALNEKYAQALKVVQAKLEKYETTAPSKDAG